MADKIPSEKKVTYVYRCKNRKCSAFKVPVESDKDPVSHIEEKGTTITCTTCSQPLILFRTLYDRSVFKKHIPAVQLGEPGDDLPGILRDSIKRVDDQEKNKP